MLEMIEAGIPGLYIFHRGEEVGCLGSRHIRYETPELLAGVQAAIAFDRAGNHDIITHQVAGRTASDAFAQSLADALKVAGLPNMRPDDTGVFTDTNEYLRLVPECTNVSVGYQRNHGPNETLDLHHCDRLLSAMLVLDTSKLVIERDPQAEEDDWMPVRRSFWPSNSMVELIRKNPEEVAALFEDMGWTTNELEDCIWDMAGLAMKEDHAFSH